MAVDPEVQDAFNEDRGRNKRVPGGHNTGRKGNIDRDLRGARPSLTSALILEAQKDPGSLPRIARKALDQAGDGDNNARNFVAERLDGKVPTPIELDTSGLSTDQKIAALGALAGPEDGGPETDQG